MDRQAQRRAALPAYYDYLVETLQATTNLGESGDDRDLYILADSAATAAASSHPPLLCRTLCSHCCYGEMGLPKVTALEWQGLHKVLVRLSKGLQRTILRQTQEQYGPILEALLPDQDAGPLPVDATVHCPLLIYEKCAAYEARPLSCRAFGSFMHRVEQRRYRPFMCHQAIEHIEEGFPEDTALPVLNPYLTRLAALHEGPPVWAYLPLWIVAHADQGRFVAEVNPRPDFRAAIARFRNAMARG